MRFEQVLDGFGDVLFESPLPSTRQGSASVRIDMSFHSEDSFDFDDATSSVETDDGRLSRSLQSWMVDHKWTQVEPLEKPPLEPVFSGKLGRERRPNRTKRVVLKDRISNSTNDKRCKTAPLRRIPSDDSIKTSLSLLTCSSIETHVVETTDSKEKKRKKRKNNSRASSSTGDNGPVVSKWIEVMSRRGPNLNKFFRNHTVIVNQCGFIAGEDDNEESEAFRMLDKDEQTALLECGRGRGIRYTNKANLERSFSMPNMSKELFVISHPLQRTLSASAKKSWSKPLDIAELKRERMNRLIAIEQAKALQEKERQRKGRRHGLTRTSSNKSLISTSSARPNSPTNTFVGTEVSNVQSQGSGRSSDLRAYSPSEKMSLIEVPEEKVSVWKGDREILEIDLKKELTQRVKEKIEKTRTALKRVTGFGDRNEQKLYVGSNEEYPKHVEEDFCHKPRIIQQMRISPHLSGIIHNDIKVRMGRPRYHEIRVSDLEQWDKGQELNRAHRNLKVFNWLHSLSEVTFITDVIPEINDDLPEEESTSQELLHVESADEPDIAPLFRQYEVRIL